jgi:hypothetical protein
VSVGRLLELSRVWRVQKWHFVHGSVFHVKHPLERSGRRSPVPRETLNCSDGPSHEFHVEQHLASEFSAMFHVECRDTMKVGVPIEFLADQRST